MEKGFIKGLPIAFGYLFIAFAFGMLGTNSGLSVMESVLISFTNLTSAGQFAGLNNIIMQASYLEVILTQVIINLRYALMSLSLSQKLDAKISKFDRFWIAFGNTDEIYAMASMEQEVSREFMFGLIIGPIIGWTSGTFLGAVASSLLGAPIKSALGIMLYGMFMAIVVPVARKNKNVLIACLHTIIVSGTLYYLPLFSFISNGLAIVIITVLVAGAMAYFYPVEVNNHA